MLQAKSPPFFLSTPLKMVLTKIMEENPCQPVLMHNLTPPYGCSVKIALKGSVMKNASYHLLHNISSEDIKSSLSCYPQNVRPNPTNCDSVMVMCWR